MLREELVKSQSIIETIKLNMKQYHEKQEQVFLKEAMETMIETLLPLMKKIYELKFAYKGLRKIQEEDKMKDKQVIYYLEKLDINEEKVRLAQHCKYFKETLTSEGEKGKKLGFISQEMGREINTMGSKANDTKIQQIVVDKE